MPTGRGAKRHVFVDTSVYSGRNISWVTAVCWAVYVLVKTGVMPGFLALENRM